MQFPSFLFTMGAARFSIISCWVVLSAASTESMTPDSIVTTAGLAEWSRWRKNTSPTYGRSEERVRFCLEVSTDTLTPSSLVLHNSLTWRSLLKGWSLGGLVSLQIARLLDDERRHAEQGTQPLLTAGIILIDSPYTPPWREHRDRFVSFEPEFPSWTPQLVRKNIMRRFEVCDELIDNWDPPRWDTYLDVSAGKSTLEGQNSDQRVRPVSSCPPVVLLKATARVPLPKSNPHGLLDVDLNRDDQLLGWERYGHDLFQTVHHVSGNHFDLFDQDDRVSFAIITILTKQYS
jgi:pimeloyl-ACP methyl ester carboxylesterase